MRRTRAKKVSRARREQKNGTRPWQPIVRKTCKTLLNHVRKSKIPLTIFLVNGVKLQGVVTWFDNFCVLLRRDGHSQLVYKHAISTIMPGHPIQLFEGAEEPPAGDKV
jgi:host factor-I protein